MSATSGSRIMPTYQARLMCVCVPGKSVSVCTSQASVCVCQASQWVCAPARQDECVCVCQSVSYGVFVCQGTERNDFTNFPISSGGWYRLFSMFYLQEYYKTLGTSVIAIFWVVL